MIMYMGRGAELGWKNQIYCGRIFKTPALAKIELILYNFMDKELRDEDTEDMSMK